MTHKVIISEFVVPAFLAIFLSIMISIGAVYLTDKLADLIVSSPAIADSGFG